jgi:hypothetical protein
MRLSFPNTTRAKGASKVLSKVLDVPLHVAQLAVAVSCGYSDWHEFERNFRNDNSSPLDQVISCAEFVRRRVFLSIRLSEFLKIPIGDAQYVLSLAHLTGDRHPSVRCQLAIYTESLLQTELPIVPRRTRGAVGVLRTAGRRNEPVILRELGSTVHVLSHRGFGMFANFEFVSPKVTPPLFVPMRLYLPYGFWTEPSGAKVLFSRDYKPLWRLREGKPPERLDPWLWINYIRETHIWPNERTPWQDSSLENDLLVALEKEGVGFLPVLSDCFPISVLESEGRLTDVSDTVTILERRRVKTGILTSG